jgi:hypothetical protein
MVGKVHGWGTFPKWGPRFGYCLILDPIIFKCPYPRDLFYTRNLEWGNSENNKLNLKLYPNSSL